MRLVRAELRVSGGWLHIDMLLSEVGSWWREKSTVIHSSLTGSTTDAHVRSLTQTHLFPSEDYDDTNVLPVFHVPIFPSTELDMCSSEV